MRVTMSAPRGPPGADDYFVFLFSVSLLCEDLVMSWDEVRPPTDWYGRDMFSADERHVRVIDRLTKERENNKIQSVLYFKFDARYEPQKVGMSGERFKDIRAIFPDLKGPEELSGCKVAIGLGPSQYSSNQVLRFYSVPIPATEESIPPPKIANDPNSDETEGDDIPF